MSLGEKLRTWSGKNKEYTRYKKIEIIKKFSQAMPSDPMCLTFPGSCAHFEKLLIDHGVTTPNRVLCIQSPQKFVTHSGAEVVSILYPKLSGLGDFPLFLGNFKDFPDEYSSKTPSSKMYRAEIKFGISYKNKYTSWRILNGKPPFSIIDIDTCGQFSPGMVETVNKLYQKDLFANNGLLFINHMKGRENIGAKKLIRESKSEYMSYFSGEHKIDMRFLDVPMIYMTNAHRYGYNLSLLNIIEYFDHTGKGNKAHMLQYIFSFSRSKIDILDVAAMNTVRQEASSAENSASFDGTLVEKRCD